MTVAVPYVSSLASVILVMIKSCVNSWRNGGLGCVVLHLATVFILSSTDANIRGGDDEKLTEVM